MARHGGRNALPKLSTRGTTQFAPLRSRTKLLPQQTNKSIRRRSQRTGLVPGLNSNRRNQPRRQSNGATAAQVRTRMTRDLFAAIRGGSRAVAGLPRHPRLWIFAVGPNRQIPRHAAVSCRVFEYRCSHDVRGRATLGTSSISRSVSPKAQCGCIVRRSLPLRPSR